MLHTTLLQMTFRFVVYRINKLMVYGQHDPKWLIFLKNIHFQYPVRFRKFFYPTFFWITWVAFWCLKADETLFLTWNYHAIIHSIWVSIQSHQHESLCTVCCNVSTAFYELRYKKKAMKHILLTLILLFWNKLWLHYRYWPPIWRTPPKRFVRVW